MGRPKGSRNGVAERPKAPFQVFPPRIPKDEPPNFEPIRVLRHRAILAGARLKPLMSRGDLAKEIERLGEAEKAEYQDRVSIQNPACYAAEISGIHFECILDRGLTVVIPMGIDVSIERFEYALSRFKEDADAWFDSQNDILLRDEADLAAYRESVKDYDGTPPQPTYDQKRIFAFAESIGIRNCNLEMAMIKTLEAYGEPLGQKLPDPDDGELHNVMWTPEEMEAKCLKCLEKPL